MIGSGNLYLALIHHPVYNKNREVIASAVSNLDLHDISRAAKTYGAQSFYVVTPLEDQRELAQRIVSHWTKEAGARYNPDRKAALELVRVVPTLDAAIDDICGNGPERPLTVATDARSHQNNIGYSALSEMLKAGRPCLLIFGTAWGMSQEFMETADHILAPIEGRTNYNHLSVRSAAAIVLDRLLGRID